MRFTATLIAVLAACDAYNLPHCRNPFAAAPRAFSRAPPPRCSADTEQKAYTAGAAAAQDAVSRASADSSRRKNPGKPVNALVVKRPLGVVLADNPSGRGVFVAEVVEGGNAAELGRRVQEGDYLVSFSVGGKVTPCSWSTTAEVTSALEATKGAVQLRLVRGGDLEPWELDRDGDGLSIDEMVEAATAEYGRLLDSEQEEALRSAFAALKEEERRKAAKEAAEGGYESDAFRAVSGAAFDLKSFVRGVRDGLETIQAVIFNRAALDARIAGQTAAYLLRRALLDTRLVFAAAATTLQLSAAPSSAAAAKKPTGRATPFADRARAISSVRSLSAAADPGARLALAAEAELDDAAREKLAAEEAARDAAMRKEAAALLREALVGVEAWAQEAATTAKEAAAAAEGIEDGVERAKAAAAAAARRPPSEPPVDWEKLRQRSKLLGGDVGDSLNRALASVRTDFEAFQILEREGQLPTIVEELTTGDEGGGAGGAAKESGAKARLRSFAAQDGGAGAARKSQLQRREAELRAKQLKLAGSVGQRAAKDGADLFVYGAMPSATAVGKLAARRAAAGLENLKSGGGGGGGGGADGLVGELAAELAKEYAASAQRAATLGPLAGLADVAAGSASKLRDGVGNLISGEPATPTLPLGGGGGGGAPRLRDDLTKLGDGLGAFVSGSLQSAKEEAAAKKERLRSMRGEGEVEVVAERVSFAEEDEVEATTRPMGERVSYADDEASAAAASGALVFDGAVEGEEFEMDALDVGAVEEEDTGGEALAQAVRLADSSVAAAELLGGTLISRVGKLLTPESAKGWELLTSFEEEGYADRGKAVRVKTRLLDDLGNVVRRK